MGSVHGKHRGHDASLLRLSSGSPPTARAGAAWAGAVPGQAAEAAPSALPEECGSDTHGGTSGPTPTLVRAVVGAHTGRWHCRKAHCSTTCLLRLGVRGFRVSHWSCCYSREEEGKCMRDAAEQEALTAIFKELVERVEQQTHFSKDELFALQEQFLEITGCIGEMSRDMFRSAFPAFDQTNGTASTEHFPPHVLDNGEISLSRLLFNAIDEDSSGWISFDEYAVALSVACRGTPEERAALAFRVFDVRGDGSVAFDEAQVVAELLETCVELATAMRFDAQALKLSLAPQMPGAAEARLGCGEDKVLMRSSSVLGVRTEEVIRVLFARPYEDQSEEGGRRGDADCVSVDEEDADGVAGGGGEGVGGDEGLFFVADQLTKEEFMAVARQSAPMRSLFGLFPYMYSSCPLAESERIRRAERLEKSSAVGESSMALAGVLRVDGEDKLMHVRAGFLWWYAGQGAASEKSPKRSRWCKKNKPHADSKDGGGASAEPEGAADVPPEDVMPLQHAAVARGDSDCAFVVSFGSDRVLSCECTSKEEADRWRQIITVNTGARGLAGMGEGRFSSFAEERSDIRAQWYVSGDDYFEAIYGALMRSKRRVLIAGWWLQPHVPILRAGGRVVTLLEVLVQIAERGVQVYVSTWQEAELGGLGLASIASREELNAAHANIHASTHPETKMFAFTHHQKIVAVDDACAFVGGFDLCYMRYDTRDFPLFDGPSLSGAGESNACGSATTSAAGTSEGAAAPSSHVQRYPGRDYGNLHLGVERSGPPDTDQIDRSRLPRLPWHDISVEVNGKAAADIVYNFIQRWNHSIKTSTATMPFITPLEPLAATRVKKEPPLSSGYPRLISKHCNVQVLRSASQWSMGVLTEQSIYQSYLDAIRRAQRYIFICQQFFLSSVRGKRMRNEIANAIVQRISRAIENDETFRVMVILPLAPGSAMSDVFSKHVLKWTLRTIFRSEDSIVERLRQKHGNDLEISKYLAVFGLRKWEEHNERLYTEQVYVHTKAIIVDDLVAIVGSANINDRCMTGSGDSDIAVRVADTDRIPGILGGSSFIVGRQVRELRKQLFSMYFGSTDDKLLNDPMCDESYATIARTAAKNSSIYAQCFKGLLEEARCLDDHMPVPDMKTDLQTARTLLQGIRGLAVPFPSSVFIDEHLKGERFNLTWRFMKFMEPNVYL